MLNEAPSLPGLNYVRRLGRGGYAEVFLYEQTNPRMRVAVKVLFAESLSANALEQFAAEANTMAELADHPNIVQVFRSDVTDDGRPYLVMKYYPQRNLAVRARTERFSVPEVLQIGVRVACAVETAHRAGILHRDIKPANILTSQYGEPGLTDFGIATTGAEGEDEAEGLSIPWSPPEVVFGTAPATTTADVYSLGATLWHLLVGHSPFEDPGGDNSSIAVLRRLRQSPPPRTGRDDVPASLERLLAQTLAKSPLDRPQSALQLARALQGIESEQRWAPTPLVLLAADDETPDDLDDVPLAYGEDLDESPGTRASRPQPVTAQAADRAPRDETETRRRLVVVSPEPAASPAVDGGAQRVRQGMPTAADESRTIHRPIAVGPARAPAQETPVARAPTTNRTKIVVAAIVVAAAVVGVGVFLAGSGPHSAGTTTTTGASTAPSLVSTPQTPNAPTNIVGQRINPAQVRFTWDIPDQQAHDHVWWVDSGDPSLVGVQHVVASNEATVPATGQVCITVYVQNGASAEASSSPMCGGG